jgi:hypothetical protein
MRYIITVYHHDGSSVTYDLIASTEIDAFIDFRKKYQEDTPLRKYISLHKATSFVIECKTYNAFNP